MRLAKKKLGKGNIIQNSKYWGYFLILIGLFLIHLKEKIAARPSLSIVRLAHVRLAKT